MKKEERRKRKEEKRSNSFFKLFTQLIFYNKAGQEKFRAISQQYYRNAHGAILVYDITNMDSYRMLETWLDPMIDLSGKNKKKEEEKNKKRKREQKKDKKKHGAICL